MSKSVSGMKRNNRSVQDIEPNKQVQQSEKKSDHGDNDDRPPRRSRDKRAATYGMWFIGIVAVLLVFFLLSVVFAETTVTVTPRTAPISVNDSFSAQPSGTGTSSAGTLTYSVVSVSNTATRTATSSGSQYREERAQGEITVYNEYSDSSLNLVPNTRFEAPNGNIYRTQSSLKVPGRNDGQPGKVTVPVIASEAGSSYNLSGDVRFSVPGFDGTPQEGQVYAKLGSPITGGVADEVPVVSTSTKQEIAESVSETLRSGLDRELSDKIPGRMIVYNDSRFYTTDTSLDTSGQSQAEVTVSGTLKAVGFDRRELSIFLANNSGINATADSNVEIQNLESFEFTPSSTDEFEPTGQTPLEFELSGESLVVWQYNKQALARDLQSLQRNQINDVLKKYPSIQSATVNTRPFWKRQLPQNPSEITIETKLQTGTSTAN